MIRKRTIIYSKLFASIDENELLYTNHKFKIKINWLTKNNVTGQQRRVLYYADVDEEIDIVVLYEIQM